MVQAIPAPSLRELSRPSGVTEGVSSDGCLGPMVLSVSFLALKLSSGYVHRGTLPQSRIRSTAPSERAPGMGAHHPTCRSEAATLRAIFIAPTKGVCHSTFRSEIFTAKKNFRFPPGERYRVGQGTCVWEPAQSVTKKIHRGCGLWRKILWRTGEFTAG